MSVALYMDVHVPLPITSALRLRGVDVLTAQEDGASRFCEIVRRGLSNEPVTGAGPVWRGGKTVDGLCITSGTKQDNGLGSFQEHQARDDRAAACAWNGVPIPSSWKGTSGSSGFGFQGTEESHICAWLFLAQT